MSSRYPQYYAVNGRPVTLFDLNSAGLGQAIFYVHVTANATAAVRRFEAR